MKKVTSLSLGFSFLIMSYTGVILYIAPHGRIAKWIDWHFLGLDKTQYQELHITSMVTFLVFGILHIYYNWKPIISYMKDSTKEQLDRIEKKLDTPLNQVWFSISDVTRLTGLSRSTINRYISNGQLKTVKSGGKRMMRKEWVDKWIMG